MGVSGIQSLHLVLNQRRGEGKSRVKLAEGRSSTSISPADRLTSGESRCAKKRDGGRDAKVRDGGGMLR